MGRMLLVFIPQVVFYGIGMVATAALAARRRFMAAALAPAVNNLIVITCYLLYRASLDGRSPSLHLTPWQFALIAGGTTLAVIVFTAIPAIVLTAQHVPWRPRWEPGSDVVRRVRRAFGWAMLSVAGTLAPQGAAIALGYGATRRRGRVHDDLRVLRPPARARRHPGRDDDRARVGGRVAAARRGGRAVPDRAVGAGRHAAAARRRRGDGHAGMAGRPDRELVRRRRRQGVSTDRARARRVRLRPRRLRSRVHDDAGAVQPRRRPRRSAARQRRRDVGVVEHGRRARDVRRPRACRRARARLRRHPDRSPRCSSPLASDG